MSFAVHATQCAAELHFIMSWTPTFVHRSLESKYLLNEERKRFQLGWNHHVFSMFYSNVKHSVNDGEDKGYKLKGKIRNFSIFTTLR